MSWCPTPLAPEVGLDRDVRNVAYSRRQVRPRGDIVDNQTIDLADEHGACLPGHIGVYLPDLSRPPVLSVKQAIAPLNDLVDRPTVKGFGSNLLKNVKVALLVQADLQAGRSFHHGLTIW